MPSLFAILSPPRRLWLGSKMRNCRPKEDSGFRMRNCRQNDGSMCPGVRLAGKVYNLKGICKGTLRVASEVSKPDFPGSLVPRLYWSHFGSFPFRNGS